MSSTSILNETRGIFELFYRRILMVPTLLS